MAGRPADGTIGRAFHYCLSIVLHAFEGLLNTTAHPQEDLELWRLLQGPQLPRRQVILRLIISTLCLPCKWGGSLQTSHCMLVPRRDP